jgi:outer membrane protein OmpA-like peptidoglycan-associated protein
MSQAKKKIIAVAAPFSLVAGLALAPVQYAAAQGPEYLSDSQGEEVTNSYEECWEVSYGLEHCGEPPAPVAETITITTDGLFDFDSAVIKPELAAKLDEVATRLEGRDYSSVAVTGHTCSIGTEAYNQGLSERRAQAAADYLAGQGVDTTKMTVGGEGELNPAYSNDTSEGRAKNRRVEISVN